MYVGIDLGTTYSTVAKFDTISGKPVILRNGLNKEITPSVVSINNGKIRIGENAKRMQLEGMGENTAAFYKCMMGDLGFSVNIEGVNYNAESLSAIFLRELVRDVSAKNGIKIESAVITVPAYFNEEQRSATLRAGKTAGLNVLKIINEPTAAIVAHGIGQTETERTVLVYDLGGGTFDISIAKVLLDRVDVIATIGNHNLGGKNWDCALREYVANEYYDRSGIKIEDEFPEYYSELLVMCEDLKKQLTDSDDATIRISLSGIEEDIEVSLQSFDSVTEFCLKMTTDLIDEVFDEIGNGFSYSDIDEIVLVGGSTRMRQVYNLLKNSTTANISVSADVDCVVAYGAAIQAELSSKKEVRLTLRGKAADGEQRRLTLKSSSIVDVTAHSMGAITVNETNTKYINTIIIKKNSSIPVEQKQLMAIPNVGEDTFIDIYVTQGENIEPEYCTLLGKYHVSDFDEDSYDYIKTDILYRYDDNGMVAVSAIQCSNGKILAVAKKEIGDVSWMTKPPKPIVVKKKREQDIYLILDASGSMSTIDRKKAAQAAENFVNTLTGTNHISVVVFADREVYLCSKTNSINKIKDALNKYKADTGYSVGGSTEGQPLSFIEKQVSQSKNPAYVVVLTDGYWGNKKNEIKAAQRLAELKAQIMAVGIGSADSSFLKSIATNKEFAFKTDVSSLTTSFSGIARAINDGTIKSIK